jgi:hypothetical protein
MHVCSTSKLRLKVSTTSMFLSNDEITDLTNRQRPAAQVRALRIMGIEHRIRPDGTVAILRAHVEHLLGYSADAKVVKEYEWGEVP